MLDCIQIPDVSVADMRSTCPGIARTCSHIGGMQRNGVLYHNVSGPAIMVKHSLNNLTLKILLGTSIPHAVIGGAVEFRCTLTSALGVVARWIESLPNIHETSFLIIRTNVSIHPAKYPIVGPAFPVAT